jgi:hypothetical protein
MPSTVRSVLAILAGFVLIGLLAFGTDAILMAAGVFPPMSAQITSVGLLLGTLVYVAAYAIFGCWLAAALAPSQPMRHALILGGLGLAFQLVIMATTPASGRTPLWYNLLNLALVMPFAWAGGALRERQLQQRENTPALAQAS